MQNHGEKAGIYFGPFVFFGSATDATNWFVEGTANAYRYSDVLLRDGNGNVESIDGGLAVDPTHAGARQRVNYYVNLFTNWGFDYVKLDFLSHGAMEGVHFDTNVTTGIQAYNQGMQYVHDQINGRMFISESIARSNAPRPQVLPSGAAPCHAFTFCPSNVISRDP